MCENTNKFDKEVKIYGMAMDPIYVGTGGYTIGRVDNTIVRDPINRLPKIPGSSIAGTWRYYVALKIHEFFEDDEMRIKKNERRDKKLEEIFIQNSPEWVVKFEGNRYAGIKCAGHDDLSTATLEESREKETGHCGHCIVCKGFGYSKRDMSWQGMMYFSDLNILFFPVFTMLGTKWITTKEILENANLFNGELKVNNDENHEYVYALKEIEKDKEAGYINIGWLYLPYKIENMSIDLNKIKIEKFMLNYEDIIIVSKEIFSQIVNSNLEVRTSVSIDPITGAAKEGALFTSEAIPRGTIFYGNLRIFDKSTFVGLDKTNDLPDYDMLKDALNDSKHFFETLGIGGMTTRGFGRLRINELD
ncbi:RAMP superfamily CRISPR-associated protein [Thermoanaerobacterium sp. R66]|uniref:RAMP superfamily CRISPR-associated protein n=1 Tax=Thermoanaerobacterium sp. R66 TaxID=2742479 RepID=UPI002380158C|nr:RAMP superfamily CRISPR-associated protein [Thermoanaerobacterium sp. R66]MDE4543260.1 hypothetical protein [Thermoanaerobacterium sp. R66]